MFRIQREVVALKLLAAMIEKDGAQGEKTVREAFDLALTFEKVSDEVGGRPMPTPGVRRRPNHNEDEEEDD